MIRTALLAIKYLSKNQLGHGGTLVNVSQHIDIKSTAQLPIYTATKHAMIGLSQSLAVIFIILNYIWFSEFSINNKYSIFYKKIKILISFSLNVLRRY